MEESVSPPVALRLSLQQAQCKAVQDVMDLLAVDTESHLAPVQVTKGKLLSSAQVIPIPTLSHCDTLKNVSTCLRNLLTVFRNQQCH